MPGYKYRKPHKIRIFSIDERKENNVAKVYKVYFKYPDLNRCTPEEAHELAETTTLDTNKERTDIFAHIRQLSATERYIDKAEQDDSTIVVVINNRPVEQGMYLEFNGAVYKIGAPDHLDFSSGEIKFRATNAIPPAFDGVEYRGWHA